MSKEEVERIVRELGNCTGAKAHPHKFRRTFATKAIDRGMPIQDVSKLMGHEKLDTTLIYYSSNNNHLQQSYRQHIA